MRHIESTDDFYIHSDRDFPVQADMDCSVINVFTRQVERHAQTVFLRYRSNGVFKTLTYQQVDRLTTNLAYQWQSQGLVGGVDVVGFLADQTVDYFLCMLTFLKLRVVFMTISPRVQEAALGHLVEASKGTAGLGITRVFATKNHIASAQALAQAFGLHAVELHPLDKEALLSLNYTHDIVFRTPETTDADAIVAIMHSSGSTSFPKLIPLSNRYLIHGTQGVLFQPVNDCPETALIEGGGDTLLSCLPLYHMSGVIGSFMMMIVGGSIIFLENFPAAPSDILEALEVNGGTIFHSSPFTLEQLAPSLKNPRDCTTLQRLKFMGVGGGRLAKEIGDRYQENNVNVYNIYGMTEIALVMCTDMKRRPGKRWDVLRPLSGMQEYVAWEPYNEKTGQYLLVIKGACPGMASGVANRENGDYATGDLFTCVSPGSNQWLYCGRRDDMLVLTNSENINPVPIEAALRRANIIKYSSVIGEYRPCVAALVELDLSYAMSLTPQQIIEQVHDAVDVANEESPSYSHILPQMVYILPLSRHLPVTDKGSVPRKRVLQEFASEIETMYNYLLNPSLDPRRSAALSNRRTKVVTVSANRVRDHIAGEVAKLLRKDVSVLLNEPKRSVFDFGFNSLLAIQLGNILSHDFGMEKVPQTFVYDHPSLDKMAQALSPLSTNTTCAACQKIMTNIRFNKLRGYDDKHYHQTERILQDYLKRARKEFDHAYQDRRPTRGREQVVFLTGATGSVGSFILRDLIRSPQIAKVYVAVRGSDARAAKIRLAKALSEHGLGASLLLTSKVKVLAADLNRPDLGLSQEEYDKVKRETTLIQACGWLLDFYHPIAHFQRHCLEGLYHLLKLAYRRVNPMRVHMISSVSASANWGEEVHEEPLLRDPYVAMPMGYAQSKYIAEQLLNYMTSAKGVPCFIERVGQVCGDTEHGFWNPSEQFPLMITGGQRMRKMPQLDEVVDWLPINYVASAVVEIMLATADHPAVIEESVFHIVHPRPVHWSDVLGALRRCGMRFETVSFEAWADELSQDEANPAYRMLSFYKNRFGNDFQGAVRWRTDKTAMYARSLAKAPTLSDVLFQKYLQFWHHSGLMEPLQQNTPMPFNTFVPIVNMDMGKVVH